MGVALVGGVPTGLTLAALSHTGRPFMSQIGYSLDPPPKSERFIRIFAQSGFRKAIKSAQQLTCAPSCYRSF